MKIALQGDCGPLADATRAEAQRRGHEVVAHDAECVIFFPGKYEQLRALIQAGGFRRLVLRSHASAYGIDTKNPGFMSESRTSLSDADAPEQRWLVREELAARHPSWAAVRLSSVLDAGEGDVAVRKLRGRIATTLLGQDPNLQFISLRDAARALVAAAESNACGIFNAAGAGAVPLRAALRAAGTMHIPVPRTAFRLAGKRSIDELRYNWTISGERAAGELGFRPELSTVEALREWLRSKPGAHPERLRERYDDWGLDEDYIRRWSWWFDFLQKLYWRVEYEGVEHVPESGRAVIIGNHRGFMPFDGVMCLRLVQRHRRRIIRYLIVPGLLKFPVLYDFIIKLGGVIANQENAARLLAAENLVGIFPEGVRGAFELYRRAYQSRDYANSAVAPIAVANQAPIVPVAAVGHAEAFPVLARIHWSYLKREYTWPYLPITPTFPLAPVPLPSKWHIRFLPPVPLTGLAPADAENRPLMAEFSRYLQHIVQSNVDDMRARRRWIFWGRIFDGRAPERPAFTARQSAAR